MKKLWRWFVNWLSRWWGTKSWCTGSGARVRVSGEIVCAEVVKRNPRSLIVRLPDGRIVKRKRWRDAVDPIERYPWTLGKFFLAA